MNITKHPYPAEKEAFENGRIIQFSGISATSDDAWFDFDPDSSEPPSFDSKVLKWRVKPTALHPIFASVLEQFNSQFGGVK